MRRAERRGGGEVVGDLRHHARPVDRVDAGEPDAVAEGQVVEHGLHAAPGSRRTCPRWRPHARSAPLAVVIMRRCTSETRPFGKRTNASTRLEPRNASIGGAAGVARGGADHGHALVAGGQHAIHEAREQLHRHILEGERGAVEQLQHPSVAAELDQRRDGRMAEAGIGVAAIAGSSPRGMAPPANRLQNRAATSANGFAGKVRNGCQARGAARPSARRGRRRGQGPASRASSKPSSGASPLVLT